MEFNFEDAPSSDINLIEREHTYTLKFIHYLYHTPTIHTKHGLGHLGFWGFGVLFLKTLLWCSNATDSVTSLTVVLNASSVYTFSSGFSARTFLNFRLARLHIVSITLKSQL